jgi:UDP-N-acetylmuramate: L-alanyl-gamma-D-glutamyl-meso-diaminopimelate ligase
MLGIGGAAMAPVAGMLKEAGHQVTGSDAGVYPPASTLLESLDIPWNASFDPAHLQPAPDLAVIGNVIARGNPELEYILDEKIPYKSMPAVIEEFFLPGRAPLVVAGTHGKTTITALLAWIFQVAGRRPGFLIGGVVPNFNERSYGLGDGREFIIEGDEYETAFFDRGPKFMHYHPQELILTSCEFDHADIFADLAAVETQFRLLVNLVPRSGRIVAWGESDAVRGCVAKAFCPVETYGLSAEMDWCAGDIEWRDGMTHFRVAHRGAEMACVRTALTGRHNVLNATAAIALAVGRGIESAAIAAALETFQGVRRRMEIKGEAAGVLVVEDFAHHPTAIRMTLEAARSRWPGRRLWAAFEPRSNSMRHNIFQDVLPEALEVADAVVLGPVNRPHLLEAGDRLDPEQVAAQLRVRGRLAGAHDSASAIAEYLGRELRAGDVVMVMSNGSFDGLCGLLLEKLRAREEVRQ